MSTLGSRGEWLATLLVAASFPLIFAHAFIPIEEFIHRGDDAYYYFGLAANFPELGFWSFDRIHPTNGAQPLWAMLLTGVSVILHAIGVTDRDVLARVFVGLCAVLQFGSSLLLLRLVARSISFGTAIAAAGAFLFPLGIVWSRVWGMESALYALLLVATVYFYQYRFSVNPKPGYALGLGLLLGLTALARLNACFLIPFVLLDHLWRPAAGRLRDRLQRAVVAGAVASALLLLYAGWNLATTDHVLPVSGAVKSIRAAHMMEDAGVTSRLSWGYVELVGHELVKAAPWFISSRAMDATWIAGGRVIFREDGALPLPQLWGILALFALAPLLLGKPRAWLQHLGSRLGRLAVFRYVLLFGIVDLAVSCFLYPQEIRYSMTRWWLIEWELILVVAVSTLVVACTSYLAAELLGTRYRVRLVVAWLGFLLVFSCQQMVRFYWDDEVVRHDWNASWNDEMYLAAKWLSANVPEDAIVGSWNAGALGYYAIQRVVNLDGLANNFEIVPYLEDRRIDRYIKSQNITHVSDLGTMFRRHPVQRRLKGRIAYRHHSKFIGQWYVIFAIED